MAGRVMKGSPAGINLEVPPYYYINDTTILVGESKGVA
jgi:ubiquinol-cytochrome c reductase iron-sulfur subunit